MRRPWPARASHALTSSPRTTTRRPIFTRPLRLPHHEDALTFQHRSSSPSAIFNRSFGAFSPTAASMSAITVSVSSDAATTTTSNTDHHVGNPPKSFRNPWPSAGSGSQLLNALKTRFGPDRNLVPIPTDAAQLVPVRKPDWAAGQKGLKATWLGHASFLVETSIPGGETASVEGEGGAAVAADRGVRILLDPVFSKRMSPVSFAGPLRFVELPCELEDVPEVDCVIISHNHYDHLDVDTIKKIYLKREQGNVHFFCALGIRKWFESVGIATTDITELDWWQECSVSVQGAGSITLACTPSQHFSGRGAFDHGQALWCSWVLKDGSDTRLFFAGDTGYRSKTQEALAAGDEAVAALPHCPAFKEIGSKYGPFDLSLLPIGCYSPRHSLSKIHCSPEDSVEIHKDVRSRKSIGMHYGTIRGGLSQYYEPVTDPPKVWQEACAKAGLKWGEEVGLCDIGETVVVQPDRTTGSESKL